MVENKEKSKVTDGRYILIKLSETDRENYYRLLEETNEIPGFYDRPGHYELMWRTAMEYDELNYSIYNDTDEYCGNIILKHPESSTPEIGIDLLVKKRNQGIAASCIKLLARTVHNQREDIEYFILRVSSKNLHSKHMIEKLGAIFVCEEETLYQRYMKCLIKERADECTDPERKQRLDELLAEWNEEKMNDDEVIYKYKLLGDMYL